MHLSRPARALGLGALALAAAALVAPVALAAIPKVDVYPQYRCVGGPWSDGTSVTFQLRTAAGTLKDSSTDVANDGTAFGCFGAPIKPGDRIRIKVGGERRTFTVPRLTLGSLDRATDELRGKAQPGAVVRLKVDRCALGQGFDRDSCADVLSLKRTAGARGGYRFDTTGTLNLRGRDLVEVIRKAASGDRVRQWRTVPVFFVTNLGDALIDGVFEGHPEVVFLLRDGPGGPILGSAPIASPDTSAPFRDGATPVDILPGHQIVGDFSTDAKMLVPAMIGSVDAGADTITATCFAGQPYRMSVFGSAGGIVTGKAGPGGAITIDAGSHGIDIQVGDDLRLECLTKAGDSIRMSQTLD